MVDRWRVRCGAFDKKEEVRREEEAMGVWRMVDRRGERKAIVLAGRGS